MIETVNNVTVDNEFGNEPSTIRLLDADKNVLDSVQAVYEDSFSLESFADSIKNHQEMDPPRRFIIARVQTWDRKQPDKAYYSYYNAFHLNKILFQTQVYLGKKLIHRLLVLNPLTNTDIIGDVAYFMVFTKYRKNGGNNPSNLAVIEEGKSNPMLAAPQENTEKINNERRKSMVVQERLEFYMRKALPPTEVVGNPSSGGRRPSVVMKTGVVDANTAAEQRPRIATAPARKRIMSEKKETVKETRRHSFLTPSEQAEKKIVPKDILSKDQISISIGNVSATETEDNSKRVDFEIKKSNTSINIPAGTITQFSKPVPQGFVDEIAPETPKTRRRVLSYANSKQDSNVETDLAAWNKQAKELGSIYDAVYIGNDADYLDKSAMRGLFRDHACAAEDVKLFEMPEVVDPNGTDIVDATSINDDFYAHPLIYRILMNPSQRQLRQMPFSARAFHLSKCWLLAIIVIATLFLLVIFTLKNNKNGFSS